MHAARLEHVNVTVRDPAATAERLQRLLDWKVRWQGEAIDGGHAVHVGRDDCYLALYAPPAGASAGPSSYATLNGLNHVAVVVDDLDELERRVRAEGLVPGARQVYAPGERFYVDLEDGLELELVRYDG